MGHPRGGKGNTFNTRHTFAKAYAAVSNDLQIPSTTGETVTARHGTSGSRD